MAAPVVILLPPSEGKAPGGAGRWRPASGRFASLAPARRLVAGELAAAMVDDGSAAAVCGVRGVALTRARSANQTTVGAPALPAGQRYRGVVWGHLDPLGLRGRAETAAHDVVVVSALAGLAGMADPLPDYKLKMGARLPGVGALATFWRPQVTAALAAVARGATIWDLLPAEHARAVDLDALAAGARIVRVVFLTASGRAVGHEAKAAKGRFARHLLEVGTPASPRALARAVARFEWPGWSARLDGAGVVVERVGTPAPPP